MPENRREVRSINKLGLAYAGLMITSFPWSFSSTADQAESFTSAPGVVKVGILGVAVAVGAALRQRGERLPASCLLLVVYAGIALLGSSITLGFSMEGSFRAIRLAFVLVVISWIGGQIAVETILRVLICVAVYVAVLALFGAGSKLGVSSSRLYGFMPSLHPNLLASMAGLGLVSLIVLWMRSGIAHFLVVTIATLLCTVIYLTGSRTSMASASLGVVIVSVHSFSQGVGRSVFLAWFASMAGLIAIWVSVLTSVNPFSFVLDLISRDGTSGVDPTLTGRTDAWATVLSQPRSELEVLFGSGLQNKTVMRQVGNVVIAQGLDNSWVAAFAAAGIIGLLMLMLAGCGLLLRAFSLRSAMAIASVSMLLASSWTESSFADISFGLLAAMSLTMQEKGVERRDGNRGLREREPAAAGV